MSDLKQQVLEQQQIVVSKLVNLGVDEMDAEFSVMMAGSKNIDDILGGKVKSTDNDFSDLIGDDWNTLVQLSNQLRQERDTEPRDTRSDAQVRADTAARLSADQAREDWYE